MATRILHSGEHVTVGEFVCQAGERAWTEVNFIGDAVHLVYPRTHVVISQLGHPSVLATPNHAMIYEANQPYRRELASPAGDHCHFLRIEPERVEALLAEVPDRRLPAPALPLDPLSYLLVHRLVERLMAADAPDVLEVGEAVATLERRTLAAGGARPSAAARRRHRHRHALAEAAKEFLADTFSRRVTLSDIGSTLHVSPWHLARLFREETGFTLHAYRQQLRLRRALQLLSDGADLSEVALAVGFSSHSHLTTAFSRAFGRPPSHARVVELRTIVEAGTSSRS